LGCFNQPIGEAIMTTLREKMKQEMELFDLAPSTQKRYMEVITKLYVFYNKSPQHFSEDEIKHYLLTLKKRI
jgi:hypothetical protein